MQLDFDTVSRKWQLAEKSAWCESIPSRSSAAGILAECESWPIRIMSEIDATNWFTWHDSTLTWSVYLSVCLSFISLGWSGWCGPVPVPHCCNLTTLISVFLSFSLVNFGAFSH